MRLAWVTEFMARQQQLNKASIDVLMKQSSSRQGGRQTPGQMRAAVELLRQMYPRSRHKSVSELAAQAKAT